MPFQVYLVYFPRMPLTLLELETDYPHRCSNSRRRTKSVIEGQFQSASLQMVIFCRLIPHCSVGDFTREGMLKDTLLRKGTD